jgi:hypothetical protein
MKIVPKRDKDGVIGAIITINEKDAIELAAILSFAVRTDSGGKMLFQLAAACEGVTPEANAYLQQAVSKDKKLEAAYDKIRKAFDPGYGGGGE